MRLKKLVPGSARNWIAVRAVKQSASTKMKTKMTTLLRKDSINFSVCRYGFLLIALVCFALSSTVEAGKGPPIFPSPTPTPTPTPAPTPTPTPTPIDGDLGNGNTAEG